MYKISVFHFDFRFHKPVLRPHTEPRDNISNVGVSKLSDATKGEFQNSITADRKECRHPVRGMGGGEELLHKNEDSGTKTSRETCPKRPLAQ